MLICGYAAVDTDANVDDDVAAEICC